MNPSAGHDPAHSFSADIKKYALFLIIAVGIFVLDQFTKGIIRNSIHTGQTVHVLGDFFRLHHSENPGTAFGLSFLSPMLMKVMSLVAVIILAVIVFFSLRAPKLQQFGFAFITGGAAGNLVDRLLYGRVTDFLDFGLGSYRFWTFNVADTFITVGSGLVILSILLDHEKNEDIPG